MVAIDENNPNEGGRRGRENIAMCRGDTYIPPSQDMANKHDQTTTLAISQITEYQGGCELDSSQPSKGTLPGSQSYQALQHVGKGSVLG